MDIKKLTQEVLLKNMTPEQQMAVLESVQASVKEAKAVQKQKIAENVDLVLQALKRIEADMLKRVDGSAQLVENRVKTIKDGKDGKNGLDGKAGKDGINGKDGKDGRDGRDGLNGKAGERGQDGVGVQNAHIDFDGSLIIALTNGQELNVGEVVPFDVAEKIRVIGNGGGTSQYVLDAIAALQAQINAIAVLPSQTGNAGKFLTTDGTNASWASVAGGLSYQGTWNASTNTPTLVSSTGTNGYYYIVGTAGATNLNGITDWQVGDWLLFNGSTWQKLDQTNLVTSVAGRTGNVVLSNTDISGLGTMSTQNANAVAITGGTISGTTLTSDTVSNNLAFTPVAAPSYSEGLVFYDSTDHALCYYNDNSQMKVNIAQESIVRVRNQTGSTIPDGTVVYVNGATGNTPTIAKAIASSFSTADIIGVTTTSVANNGFGYATISGVVNGIDTSAFTDGQTVFVSATTAGLFTATEPVAPNYSVQVGVILRANPTTGTLLVAPQIISSEVSHVVGAGTIITQNANAVAITGGTITGITDLAIADGGTGASTAAGALTNLGAYPASNPSGYTANTGTVTSITAGTGLSGGTITTSGTVALSNTAVTAGSYTASNITVDAQGRITAASNGTAGASISNDTTTSTNVYPLFAAATSGTPTTIYTGNAKYLYKPSTGELQSSHHVSTNGITINSKTISTSYTIASGQSGVSAGPITIASGVSVTISSGSRWVVL